MTFKIGEPVTEIPSKDIGRSKYGDVYERIRGLSGGESLPVTFDDATAAVAFLTTARKQSGIELARRGNVVYCSKKSDD